MSLCTPAILGLASLQWPEVTNFFVNAKTL